MRVVERCSGISHSSVMANCHDTMQNEAYYAGDDTNMKQLDR